MSPSLTTTDGSLVCSFAVIAVSYVKPLLSFYVNRYNRPFSSIHFVDMLHYSPESPRISQHRFPAEYRKHLERHTI